METEIRNAIHDAVIAAITEIGLEKFKKTSFFLNNERGTLEQKLAA